MTQAATVLKPTPVVKATVVVDDDAAAQRPYHHGDLSRALVLAGRRILESQGVAALSLRAVAREAGVSPAAPYHHFKDKGELLDAVADEGWKELGGSIVTARGAAATAKQAMTEIGVAYVCFARANPALYRIMYDAACDRASMPGHGKPDQEDNGWTQVAEAIVQAGVCTSEPREIELATIAAWCTAHGVAEMAGFREFDELKGAMGGEEAFVRAVLGHVGIFGAAAASGSLIDKGLVTRFAPSPTGHLHRGHAFSALTAERAAKAASGRFLLRIEDIDTERCRPEYDAAILEDLAWLGLVWETPVIRQSARTTLYCEALAKLRAEGLIYPCHHTRREVLEGITRAPHARNPVDYKAADGEAGLIAWRLSIDAAERALGGFDGLTFEESGVIIQCDPWSAGDIVLGRKGLGVSYHLVVVIDDAAQGVTRVIRGDDLFAATHVQRLLQALLGLPTPAYSHHPLVLRPDGKRFAKRDTAETLRLLRGRGVTAEELRNELGF